MSHFHLVMDSSCLRFWIFTIYFLFYTSSFLFAQSSSFISFMLLLLLFFQLSNVCMFVVFHSLFFRSPPFVSVVSKTVIGLCFHPSSLLLLLLSLSSVAVWNYTFSFGDVVILHTCKSGKTTHSFFFVPSIWSSVYFPKRETADNFTVVVAFNDVATTAIVHRRRRRRRCWCYYYYCHHFHFLCAYRYFVAIEWT